MGLKYLILCIFLSAIFFYSYYQKNFLKNLHTSSHSAEELHVVVPKLDTGKFIFALAEDQARLQGNPVAMHLWATWCGPCKKELPDLIAYAKKQEKKGASLLFLFVAVSDEREKVQEFLAEYLPLPKNIILAYHEKKNDPEEFFKSYSLPETFIYDANGFLVKKYEGTQDWDKVNLKY